MVPTAKVTDTAPSVFNTTNLRQLAVKSTFCRQHLTSSTADERETDSGEESCDISVLEGEVIQTGRCPPLHGEIEDLPRGIYHDPVPSHPDTRPLPLSSLSRITSPSSEHVLDATSTSGWPMQPTRTLPIPSRTDSTTPRTD